MKRTLLTASAVALVTAMAAYAQDGSAPNLDDMTFEELNAYQLKVLRGEASTALPTSPEADVATETVVTSSADTDMPDDSDTETMVGTDPTVVSTSTTDDGVVRKVTRVKVAPGTFTGDTETTTTTTTTTVTAVGDETTEVEADADVMADAESDVEDAMAETASAMEDSAEEAMDAVEETVTAEETVVETETSVETMAETKSDMESDMDEMSDTTMPDASVAAATEAVDETVDTTVETATAVETTTAEKMSDPMSDAGEAMDEAEDMADETMDMADDAEAMADGSATVTTETDAMTDTGVAVGTAAAVGAAGSEADDTVDMIVDDSATVEAMASEKVAESMDEAEDTMDKAGDMAGDAAAEVEADVDAMAAVEPTDVKIEGDIATDMEAQATLLDTAMADDQFSTLVSLVQQAGLVDALSGDGPFTVFAPTNDAFAKLDANLVAGLTSGEQNEELAEILKAHVVAGEYMAADIPEGETEIETLSGESVMVSKSADGVSVSGSSVTTADVDVSNGVIHVIDEVIMP